MLARLSSSVAFRPPGADCAGDVGTASGAAKKPRKRDSDDVLTYGCRGYRANADGLDVLSLDYVLAVISRGTTSVLELGAESVVDGFPSLELGGYIRV